MIAVKLDKRHSGHQFFEFLVKFDRKLTHTKISDLYEEFCEIRNWMTDTYGHSCELDMYMSLRYHDKKHNPKWCWSTDERKLRILMTSEVMNWFTMKYNI